MTAVPTWIKSTVPYFYRYQSPTRLDWLQTIVLQHELYIPLVSELNDPADGTPKLAELTADQLFRLPLQHLAQSDAGIRRAA